MDRIWHETPPNLRPRRHLEALNAWILPRRSTLNLPPDETLIYDRMICASTVLIQRRKHSYAFAFSRHGIAIADLRFLEIITELLQQWVVRVNDSIENGRQDSRIPTFE
jgi:hypothetical protein